MLCRLEGALPDHLSEGLRYLDLSSNNLEGPLPSNWSEESTNRLLNLSLANCELTGSLPPEWGAPGALTSLQMLELQGNHLAGSLPTSWATKARLGCAPKTR